VVRSTQPRPTGPPHRRQPSASAGPSGARKGPGQRLAADPSRSPAVPGPIGSPGPVSEPYRPVASVAEVPPGYALSFWVEEKRVLLCNVEGELFAVEDRCTHDDWPLGDSRMRGSVVECPRHGARFDVRDGAVRARPARRDLTRYPLRVVDGTIEVSFEPLPPLDHGTDGGAAAWGPSRPVARGGGDGG
jgi:3-phenylpropionate/trans-cinnamate dioxygenase ferredoxin subunit